MLGLKMSVSGVCRNRNSHFVMYTFEKAEQSVAYWLFRIYIFVSAFHVGNFCSVLPQYYFIKRPVCSKIKLVCPCEYPVQYFIRIFWVVWNMHVDRWADFHRNCQKTTYLSFGKYSMIRHTKNFKLTGKSVSLTGRYHAI